MKRTVPIKNVLLVSLAIAIGCGTGVLLVVRPNSANRAAEATAGTGLDAHSDPAANQMLPLATKPGSVTNAVHAAQDVPPGSASPQTIPGTLQNRPAFSRSRTSRTMPESIPPPQPSDAQQPTTKTGLALPISAMVARAALHDVGSYLDAEGVWVSAINDANLPADVRRDLIEDLNEDGFPDPNNVTSDDLPLISYRIQLIEELAPSAMDDVNAAAFKEAYKDLINMRGKLAK